VWDTIDVLLFGILMLILHYIVNILYKIPFLLHENTYYMRIILHVTWKYFQIAISWIKFNQYSNFLIAMSKTKNYTKTEQKAFKVDTLVALMKFRKKICCRWYKHYENSRGFFLYNFPLFFFFSKLWRDETNLRSYLDVKFV